MKNHAVFFFILIGISILQAAFATHFLYQLLGNGKLITPLLRSVDYQIYHGLGGLLMLLVFKQCNINRKWPVNLLIIGILLFCGTMYIRSGAVLSGAKVNFGFLKYLRPLGGLLLVAGWFGAAALVNKKIVRESKRDDKSKGRKKKW